MIRGIHRYNTDSKNLYCHLTNTAVQKKHKAYPDGKDNMVWSMEHLERYLIHHNKVEPGWLGRVCCTLAWGWSHVRPDPPPSPAPMGDSSFANQGTQASVRFVRAFAGTPYFIFTHGGEDFAPICAYSTP